MKQYLKIFLCVLSLIAILISSTVVFCVYNLHIDLSLQIKKMVYTDYYASNHFLLNKQAEIYKIHINDYISHDDVTRTTTYSFSVLDEVGKPAMSSEIEYPGTPKRQYYGFPRLSSSKDYLLIAHSEDIKRGYVRSYYLFVLQNIDGEDFVYPCIYDQSMISLSAIGENIPFKYVEESQIYKKWADADVCDYLKKYHQNNPEFTYKMRLGDFVANYKNILQK